MSKGKTTQYPWGTERPASKLGKLQAWCDSFDRNLKLIQAREIRDRALLLQQNWIDVRQAMHIEAATEFGPYSADPKYPWVEICENEKLNQIVIRSEASYNEIAATKTIAEVERDKLRAGIIAVRNRLCHLAVNLGHTDPDTERKITDFVPKRVLDVIEMLGLEPDSEEVYFAFHGLNETVHILDGTLGHPDFQFGWSNALQPPADIRSAFRSHHVPTLSPELMLEDAAWHWVRPLLFDGNGEMPPPWRHKALQPYGGSAVTALVALLKENSALKGRYLEEQARQLMWPFFVERREKLRFYLRLYHMECLEIDEIQHALASFDEQASPIEATAIALKLEDHTGLTHVFDGIFELLPWPDQLGPTLAGRRTPQD